MHHPLIIAKKMLHPFLVTSRNKLKNGLGDIKKLKRHFFSFNLRQKFSLSFRKVNSYANVVCATLNMHTLQGARYFPQPLSIRIRI